MPSKKSKKDVDQNNNKEKEEKIKGEEEANKDENNNKLNMIKNRLNSKIKNTFDFSPIPIHKIVSGIHAIGGIGLII